MKQPTLGTAISSLRNQKGMTQKELAEACTIDIRTLQRIESGEVAPRMHTIRQLAAALGCETSVFTVETGVIKATPESNHEPSGSELKRSFLAGIVFSINAIPVVFDLITHSFNAYFHVCAIVVHICSCIFFLKGFYLIGRRHNNQVLAVSSLLAMVLLPLVNILYLLGDYYFSYNTITYILFILLCINEIVLGIGFLTVANKNKNQDRLSLGNLYKIAGVVIIIQSVLFLSPDIAIVAVGLAISVLCNAVTTTILYREYTRGEKMIRALA